MQVYLHFPLSKVRRLETPQHCLQLLPGITVGAKSR